MNQRISTILSHLPETPGCYLMRDQYDEIIYVGKAKNLSKRVKSYFQKAHDGKTARLVADIETIDYIIVNSERESLILESNLIKEHMPKYNIMLKDDKSYPYLAVTNERHPRVVFTRDVKKKYRAIFGPYPSVKEARLTHELLSRIFKLRKCEQLPQKVCLYYHLGQCYAPCVKKVEKEVYEQDIEQIISFLKGNTKQVRDELLEKMMLASEEMRFEQAAAFRDTIEAIKTTLSETQHVNLKDKKAIDIVGIYMMNSWLAVNVLHVRGGKIISNRQNLVEINMLDSDSELLQFLLNFYSRKNVEVPKEIFLSNFEEKALLSEILNVKVTTPIRGEKQQLLALAQDNAKALYQKEIAQVLANEEKKIHLIQTLKAVVGVEKLEMIEMVDISNFGDSTIVGGVVQFRNLEPNKRGYRYYKLDDQAVQNDYEAMKTVVRRRFERLKKEKKPFPDLFVVDGGKGHVSSVNEVFKMLNIDVPLVGLAKDEKHRTSHLVMVQNNEIVEIPLGYNDLGRFFVNLQDEVHRYTIAFMQRSHSNKMQQTALDLIPGVGKSYRRRLLQEFHSVQEISQASIETLSEVVPSNVAQNIYQYFSKTESYEVENDDEVKEEM